MKPPDLLSLSAGKRLTSESPLTSHLSLSALWPLYSVAVAILPATCTSDPDYVSRVRNLNAGPGVHFVLPGLLQLSGLQHRRRSDEPAAVCPECGCTFGVGRSTERPHHTNVTGAALLPVRRRVDFKMATLVYL